MQIQTIRLQNFRALAKAEIREIPRFAVFVGANGSGKSTIFSVFQFLKSAMANGAEAAIYEIGGARGLDEVRSRGKSGPIEIEIQFRTANVKLASGSPPLITYSIEIGANNDGQIVVEKEILKYRRKSTGQPWHFLDFRRGKGSAVTNEMDKVTDESQLERKDETLKSPDLLAIKALSQFEAFPASRALGDMIENWYVSDFHIEDARSSGKLTHARHLDATGTNYSSVLTYLHRQHKRVFESLLKRLSLRIPGLTRVEPKITEDGGVLLNFYYKDFETPILAPFVSDGTIRMLAYMMLLDDPEPFPLLCVEEPENQLYPSLLPELVEEFRTYGLKGQQVFVTTHSPDFLNNVTLEEVFMLVKKQGRTEVRRAKDDPQLQSFVREGASLGELWREGAFQDVNP